MKKPNAASLAWLMVGAALVCGAHAFAQAPSPARPTQKSEAAKAAEAKKSGMPGGSGEDRKDPRKIKDDPHGRDEWFAKWFGAVSPGYPDHRQAVAEREIEIWGARIPGTAAHKAARRGGAAPDAQTGAWRCIGPFGGASEYSSPPHDKDTDTGRVTVILPHPTNPSLLYVGYAGGGLWRCRNADVATGANWVWEPMTDGLPTGSTAGNVSVGAAAFKPEDPNTLYLSLGDMMPGSAMSGMAIGTAQGMGFFISGDGGETWTRGGTLGGTTRTKTVLALPGNNVLVAGNAGVWRSTNGGASFAQVTSANGLNAGNYNAWDILRLDGGDLVVSFDGGTAYSTDNGANWAKGAHGPGFPSGGVGRVAIAASGQTLYGLFQVGSARNFPKGLMKSTDRGRTWSYQAAPTLYTFYSGDGGQAGYNHMVAVDPDDPDTVFVGTNLCVYRSVDGGSTFEAMTHWYAYQRHYMHADMHVHAWAQAGPKTLYVGTDGGLSIVRQPNIVPIPSSAGIMPAADPTFIDNGRNKNVATHLIYNIACTTAQAPPGSKHRVLAGMQDNGTRLRTEGGVAAGAYDDMIGGDGFGCLIHAKNGNLMLGSVYYAWILRSEDAYWFDDSYWGIGDESAPFYTRLIDTPADPTGNRVYTFTYYVPYVSDNFGAHWTALPTSGNGWPNDWIRSFGASPLKPGLIGATFDNRVAISDNNGATWRTFQGFPGYVGSMAEIAFDTANQGVMYVTSVAFSQTANHLWRSIDGGYTFSSIDGTASASNGFPFGIPVHVVRVDPLDNNIVYAGTDLGVYRSANQGGTWERFGADLPLVSVRDIYIAPDGSFMRIGTHGRGVWEMAEGIAPTVVSVTPTTATLAVGGAQTFAATVTGGAGNKAVAWAATQGDVTQEGVYTAHAAPGVHTVMVTSQEDPSKSGTATVTVALLTIADPPKVVFAQGTATFHALLYGLANTAVAWAATSGTIDAIDPQSGRFTPPDAAPGAPQTATITAASVQEPSIKASVQVKIISSAFDGNSKTDPQLLGLAAAFGSAAELDLGKYDFDGDGVVGNNDLAALFAAMEW
jgi:hypothetical protein